MTRFVLTAALVLGGCNGGYTVVIEFDPPELSDEVEAVDLALVPDCSRQETGEEARDPIRHITLRRDGESRGLGDAEEGTFGLYALGRSSEGCRVVAAGCTNVALQEGGSGELVVVVSPLEDGDTCGPGTRCNAGVCEPIPDAGTDAAVPDAGSDAGRDACACPPCADCTGGTCVPDHTRCGDGEFCSATAGCVAGSPCMAGPVECEDDGNPCTVESCDDARDPPVCVSEPVADGMGCAVAGSDGQCRVGECCTGCWDGASCVGGTDPTACGAGGGTCRACSCPTHACEGGSCVTPAPVAALEVGDEHVCAVSEGRLWCWGDNTIGELGVGSVGGAPRLAPVELGAAGTWTTVYAGDNHGCALRSDGTVHCWGHNLEGQVGDGTTDDRSAPVRVGTASDWTAVLPGGGPDHSCGLRGTSLWCWGEGTFGQIGDGGGNDELLPVPITGSWSDGHLGRNHTCAIRTDGTLWCWGSNSSGRLGLGAGELGNAKDTPQQVGTATDWRQISGGEAHTCGIRAGGQMWCWGDNFDGQLAQGDSTDRPAPTAVPGATDWAFVGVAKDHTCAIRTDATLWCWGENDWAQLGLGPGVELGPVREPMQVGADAGWASVALGERFTCALRDDGTVWCFGDNTFGQLGTGSPASSDVPVPVCFPVP